MKTIALLVALGGLALVGCSAGQGVSNEVDACNLAKARVTERDQFPESRIAFCDHVVAASNPPDYYVLALHSDRECEGICSTNMGWFAVQKSTSGVFEWDVAESRLGKPVAANHDVR